jgi:hypothetical protein
MPSVNVGRRRGDWARTQPESARPPPAPSVAAPGTGADTGAPFLIAVPDAATGSLPRHSGSGPVVLQCPAHAMDLGQSDRVQRFVAGRVGPSAVVTDVRSGDRLTSGHVDAATDPRVAPLNTCRPVKPMSTRQRRPAGTATGGCAWSDRRRRRRARRCAARNALAPEEVVRASACGCWRAARSRRGAYSLLFLRCRSRSLRRRSGRCSRAASSAFVRRRRADTGRAQFRIRRLMLARRRAGHALRVPRCWARIAPVPISPARSSSKV